MGLIKVIWLSKLLNLNDSATRDQEIPKKETLTDKNKIIWFPTKNTIKIVL